MGTLGISDVQSAYINNDDDVESHSHKFPGGTRNPLYIYIYSPAVVRAHLCHVVVCLLAYLITFICAIYVLVYSRYSLRQFVFNRSSKTCVLCVP